jgi:hypothetical protein
MAHAYVGICGSTAISIEKYAIVAWCSSVNAGFLISRIVAYNSQFLKSL